MIRVCLSSSGDNVKKIRTTILFSSGIMDHNPNIYTNQIRLDISNFVSHNILYVFTH